MSNDPPAAALSGRLKQPLIGENNQGCTVP